MLARHFESDDRSNVDIFMCGSTLFQWAEQDSWRQHTCTSNPQDEPPATEHQDTILQPEQQNEPTSDLISSGFLRPRIPPREALAKHASSHLANRPEVIRPRLSAKLHALYGVPIQQVHRGAGTTSTSRYALRSETAAIHPYVRSKVYDLRQHTDQSFWGPFLDDGSQEVDWEKIEAIMLILDHNMSSFARAHETFNEHAIPDWSKPFQGAMPHSFVPRKTDVPTAAPSLLEMQDPYGITGTWMRVVCFLDYTELYDHNFGGASPSASEPRPPLDTEEATRLITMRIQVTKIGPPGEEDGQALPVVHFRGTSSSVRQSWDPNANSSIKGESLWHLGVLSMLTTAWNKVRSN